MNDDRFLVRAGALDAARASASGTGDAPQAPTTVVLASLSAGQRATIRAALIAALDSDEADLVDSAAIALARGATQDEAGELFGPLLRTLRHPQKSAREAATLALGILGHRGASPVLSELLLDTPAGRQRTGQDGHVEPLVRAFAAAAMGLVGDGCIVGDLERALHDRTVDADRDTRAVAVRALGMVRGEEVRCVTLLEALLRDRGADEAVRAQAPIALAKLHETERGAVARATLPALVAAAGAGHEAADVRRSCIVALGRMATLDDAEAVAALQAALRHSDEATRHFALLGLAEVVARDDDPARHAAALATLRPVLRAAFVAPKPSTAAPWGALALALSLGEARGASAGDAHAQLRDALRNEANPSHRAAAAIALGVAGAVGAGDDVRRELAHERNPASRGYLALGLAMSGAPCAAAELRPLVLDEDVDPFLRYQVARGLGLLRDRESTPALAAALRKASTLSEACALARAIGQLRDPTAVAPLLELASDARQPPARRGFALAALGLLAEPTETPWNAAFTIGSNWLADGPALEEIRGIL